MTLSRRRFVGFSGFLGSFAGLVPWAQAARLGRRGLGEDRSERELLRSVFAYGVASEDPLPDRVILWTHVTTDKDNETVDWQVARDTAFMSIVAEGRMETSHHSDHTVKVDALLPDAGATFYYRFRARSCWSMVGRTRTAAQEVDHLRFAVVSCSSIWSGYMNAYEMIAKRLDLDLVIHCGDYIYDYPDKNEARNIPFAPEDSAVLDSLHAHRQRYRYYRKDPFLRRAHQQHPWSIVWDNHDIWTQAARVDAIQAFHEWTPIRSPRETDTSYIYRSLDFGNLARLVLLDTRHIGRDNAAVVGATNSPSILGDEQYAWVEQTIQSSEKQWNILVNQVLLSPLSLFHIPLIKKSWSSFEADRDRVLSCLGTKTKSGNIVLTGDLHISFTAHLESEGQAVGVEFLPTSVSRGNLDESLGSFITKWGSKAAIPLIKAQNPHIQEFEGTRHGYGLVDLKPEGATLEIWYVPHVEQSTQESLGYSAYVPRALQKISELRTEPSPRGDRWTVPAPLEAKLFRKGSECGGLAGSYFDMEERLGSRSRLTAVKIYGRSKPNGLECHYDDGLKLQVGSLNGDVQSYTLQEGEYFRELSVGLETELSKVVLGYLELRTDRGGLFSVGTRPLKPLQFKAGSGEHLIAFYGRADKGIDKLGPIFSVDF